MYSGSLVFLRSWIICHGPFFISVSADLIAIDMSRHSLALFNIDAWCSLNSPIVRTFGTSKRACARKPPSYVTWVFEAEICTIFLPA